MSVTKKLEIIIEKLENQEKILLWILRKEYQMDGELDALTAQVAANTTVETSAVTLIQGLAAQIAAAANDPAKLTALTATLKTSADALAAAITANTPAAPAPADHSG